MPRRIVAVRAAAAAMNTSGEAMISYPAEWCSPIQASSKPSRSRCSMSSRSRSRARVGFWPDRVERRQEDPEVQVAGGGDGGHGRRPPAAAPRRCRPPWLAPRRGADGAPPAGGPPDLRFGQRRHLGGLGAGAAWRQSFRAGSPPTVRSPRAAGARPIRGVRDRRDATDVGRQARRSHAGPSARHRHGGAGAGRQPSEVLLWMHDMQVPDPAHHGALPRLPGGRGAPPPGLVLRSQMRRTQWRIRS